jgi:zinc D-Ala-D-Ala carboxypeptidase
VKNNLKYILIIILLILGALPITAIYLKDLKQARIEEARFAEVLRQEEIAKKIKRDLEEAKRKEDLRLYLTGKFDPKDREDFVAIPPIYTLTNNKIYLRKETLEAYLKMYNTAKADGVILKIASATRNFTYQKSLWDNKWNSITLANGKKSTPSIEDGLERFKKILEYSAAPTTSRHHWGTDIDINDANPEYFDTEKGIEVYDWLIKNAPLFGFCQTYNEKNASRVHGYNEEKWHWSYLPLAKNFTQEYKNLIKDEDIKGFLGDEYVAGQDLINNYVLSINPECL